jgi:hypothetical protein
VGSRAVGLFGKGFGTAKAVPFQNSCGALLRRTGGGTRPYVACASGNEWGTRKFTAQIGGAALAILGVVQDGI